MHPLFPNKSQAQSLVVNTKYWLVHAAQAAAARASVGRNSETKRRDEDEASGSGEPTNAAAPWTMEERAQRKAFGQPQQLFNHSAAVRAALNACDSKTGRPVPLSTTAHLIPIAWSSLGDTNSSSRSSDDDASGGGSERVERCYLGVGHLHRDANPEVQRPSKRRGGVGTRDDSGGRFRFGGRYTHFWYILRGSSPFELIATSAEWCLPASQDPAECESIQFVSGLAEVVPEPWHTGRGDARVGRVGRRRHGRRLSPNEEQEPRRSNALRRQVVLSYGVGDCEAKLATVDLQRVWQMLRPLPGVAEICQS